MPRIRPPISRRKVRAHNALQFHHRYLREFDAAHVDGNMNRMGRAARKAQYWMDRFNLLTHYDDADEWAPIIDQYQNS